MEKFDLIMNDAKNKIKQIAKKNAKSMIEIRRHLHQNPELSFKEKNTSSYIKSHLQKAGIVYTENWAKHGIVATVKGELKSTKRIALRGDMDALPILESNDVSYASKNTGVMHACGHDVHTTCLLGAALILNQTKTSWGGSIQFVFQPGEEKLPGGASIMLKEKAFGKKYPEAMLGQHVHPPLEVGKVGFRAGQYMASADEIYLEIIGKGGHAALPQNLIDPVLTASKIIIALQAVVSRTSNPTIPAVLSFGKIFSDGGATNVIPDRVFIEGTLRTMDEDNRKKLHKAIRTICKSTAAAYGASCKTKIRIGYPSLYNDEELTAEAKKAAIAYLGKNNVVDLPIRMTAEDFSYYSQVMPSCFYRLGTGNIKKGITSPVHTSSFNVDEKCLEIGAGLMAYLAISKLKH